MADIAETAPFTDPTTAIIHGKRHLLVRDYSMAVTALSQACQLLAEKHGDTADELGEPYLLYGRALLGLAREEAGVLGGGVPGSEEAEDDEEEDDEEADDEKLSNVDEKEEDDVEAEEQASNSGATSENKEGEKSAESKTDDTKVAEVEAGKTGGNKNDEKAESKVDEKGGKSEEPNKTDDSKIAEQMAQSKEEGGSEKAVAGSSKESSHANGPSSSSAKQNGDIKENGEEVSADDSEDVDKEDDEDEVNNLQLAWEVLELAECVLQKRGEAGQKLLADTYRLLGEVAMESGNYLGALSDLKTCLELLQKIEPRDPRAIAEIHYQIALAYSLGNEFAASIEEFTKATALLESRIKELEEMKDPPKTEDTFYTVEGEIRELKELIPEIQEKITDMKDFKQMVIDGIKSKVASVCSNGAGTSGSDASSSTTPSVQKPASDISHLVRKKRKADEPEADLPSPSKKAPPGKAV